MFSSIKLAVLLSVLTVGMAAQQTDQAAATHILGPQWKTATRGAGMIFSGTVVAVEAGKDQALPTLEIRLRVERAIAGVKAGQTLTIREWTGAWAMHQPMNPGEHVLLLLYPPSRIGLTSPVGGPLGLVRLDEHNVNLDQLERAIRAVREE